MNESSKITKEILKSHRNTEMITIMIPEKVKVII